MDFLVRYEIFGYLSGLFTIFAQINKSKKQSLILGLGELTFFILNVYLLGGRPETIAVLFLAMCVSVVSLIYIEDHRKRVNALKAAPFLIPVVFYLKGISVEGLIATFGFFTATIAKLQKDIFRMKWFFLTSSASWIFFGYYINSTAIIIADTAGFLSISIGLARVYRDASLNQKTSAA